MKKTLTATLVLVMVMAFASTAFAATTAQIVTPAFSDIAGHQAEGELSLMAALGIMNGDAGIGGPVRPDANITRAEFSKMIVGGLGKASTAAGLMGLRPNFKDEIPSWAWGWVNAAYFMGLMKGDDKGAFRPADNISYAEVLTVLVRSVRGHEAQLPAGIWPYNYLFYAVDNGFNGSVDVGFPRLPATRGDVARMLFAMMRIDRLDRDGQPIADSSYLAGRAFEGMVTDYSDTTLTVTGHAAFTLADKVFVAGGRDFEALRNLNVRVVTDASGKAVFVEKIEASNSYAGVFKARDDSGSTKYLLFADGTKIPYGGSGSVDTRLNGDMVEDDALSGGDEVVVTLGDTGAATYIVATHFEALTYLDDDTVPATSSADTVISADGVGAISVLASARVTVNGATAGRDTLAKWDVVQIALNAAGKAVAVRATRQTVEGTVKSERTVYTTGGTTHYVTLQLANGSQREYKTAMLDATTVSTGTNGKFGLNADGAIALRITYATPTNVVLIKGYSESSGGNAVIADMRGTEVTYATTHDFSAEVGQIGTIDVNPTTNVVEDFAPFADDGHTYAIVGIDAAHHNLTLQRDDAAYIVVTDPAAYKFSGGIYTYVPFDQIGLWTTDGSTHFVRYDGGSAIEYTAP